MLFCASLAVGAAALLVQVEGVPNAQPEAPIIGGSGEFRYQYMPGLLKLPEGAEIRDAHGLELDSKNNIYLTYGNWATAISKENNGTDRNCLIRWDPDGTNGQFMTGGGDALCSGLPHGIRHAVEDDKEYFYHANVGGEIPDRKLTKTTLDGTILWQVNGTFGQPALKAYRPTWFGIPPSGPYVWLVDGYGSSNVYPFTRDGKWTGKTFGGTGSEHGKFHTCHAMTWDPRVKQMAVSDRANHRVEYFQIDEASDETFTYTKTVDGLPTGNKSLPCDIRAAPPGPALGMAIVAGLEGNIAILNEQNQLVSTVDVAGLIGHLGSIHPHDALFL